MSSMKLRPYVLALLLTAAPGWAAAFAAGPPVETFAPLPPEEGRTLVMPPGSAAAASELSAAADCHPTKRRAALVALRWRPAAAPAAGQESHAPAGDAKGVASADQRVELTKFREGFSTGRFEATRRLPGAIVAVAVDSPEVGINYYWRVLTLTAGGWVPSAVERFEVPVCPWDAPDLSGFEAALNGGPDQVPQQR